MWIFIFTGLIGFRYVLYVQCPEHVYIFAVSSMHGVCPLKDLRKYTFILDTYFLSSVAEITAVMSDKNLELLKKITTDRQRKTRWVHQIAYISL